MSPECIGVKSLYKPHTDIVPLMTVWANLNTGSLETYQVLKSPNCAYMVQFWYRCFKQHDFCHAAATDLTIVVPQRKPQPI